MVSHSFFRHIGVTDCRWSVEPASEIDSLINGLKTTRFSHSISSFAPALNLVQAERMRSMQHMCHWYRLDQFARKTWGFIATQADGEIHIIHLNRIAHYKPSILRGIPHGLWKPPYFRTSANHKGKKFPVPKGCIQKLIRTVSHTEKKDTNLCPMIFRVNSRQGGFPQWGYKQFSSTMQRAWATPMASWNPFHNHTLTI